MKKECREKSMEHKIIGCVLTILIGLPIAGYTEIGDVLRGATVFNKNCVICHGSNAEGSGPLAPSLPVKPANLTDCRLTAEDPIEVLEGIIRHGGAFTGLSSIMPAWGKKLTDQEISDVAAYVKTLCTTENWLTGDLNFPRPLITGKAFPEQEIVVGGKFAQGDTDTSSTSLAFEYRFDGLTQIEVSNSVARNHTQNDSANTGIGDTAISIKRVLAYSDERNTLVAVGVKLQFPTGDE
ncbi:MAG: c-type cytochrome, partial [bacterium]